MATGTTRPSTPGVPPPGLSAADADYDQLISRQLERTGWHVKTVDLVGGAMVYLTGAIGFFFVAALIDHWIYGLGFWGRLALLLAFLISSLFWLGGLVAAGLRRINPVYAARVIEQGTPSLKNSLVNMLMFRPNGTPIHELVLASLRQKAAADLKSVPVESAVDRSRLIQLGYLLAGTLALAAAYKILSPKDPLQTASRVLAPWAEIATPSRVQILEVSPGDQAVFFGRTVEVSARIESHGSRSIGPVTLLYSTADQQVVDRPTPMTATADSTRFVAPLPSGFAGMQQDLSYRIVAGDAASPTYRLRVVPAPTILVERLQLDFPAYTKRPRQTIERQADVVALEGTRVTVFAKANQPIKSAHLEFDPPSGKTAGVAGPSAPSASRGPTLALKVDGDAAHGTFLLELQADRRTPKYSSYQVRFVTADGQRNELPIVHPIQVLPDLVPEIELLTPTMERADVPVDSRQKIEFRAIDPDFALSRVMLRAVSGGSDVLTRDLVNDPQGRAGQTVVSLDFVPRDLHLKEGDEVTYWGVAEDNRAAPQSGRPEPNSQRTRNFLLRVVAAASVSYDGSC